MMKQFPQDEDGKLKDLYKILGVDEDDQFEYIRKKYRVLALKWHPDKTANLPEEERKIADNKMTEVNEAWAIISDESKRKQYDKLKE